MLHNLSNIKLQTLITKIFLYYPRENELKLFFDIVKSIGTMLATMLDIEPYTFDQTFSEKLLYNSDFDITETRKKS